MGYHVKQKSAEFLIRYENFDAASQALIAFAQKTEKIDWVDKKLLFTPARGTISIQRWMNATGSVTGTRMGSMK